MGNIIQEYEKQLQRIGSVIGSKDLPITQTAERELSFWKGKKETSAGTYDTLKKYWDNVRWSSDRWTPSGTPWSAAFISYIMRGTDFPGSAAHSKYVAGAMKGKGGWRAISIPKNQGRIQLSIGDILVKPRSGGYSNSHGDVVFKIGKNYAYLAGGNLSNSAKVIKVPVGNGRILGNAGKYLVLLKKNPKKHSAFMNKVLAYGGFAAALGLTALLGVKVAKRKGLIGSKSWKPSDDPEIRAAFTRSKNEQQHEKKFWKTKNLYRTGEKHSNGWDVYREVGRNRAKSKWGLGGKYYISDGYTMYEVGKPYKDEFGYFDGEPSHAVQFFVRIVE